MILMLNVVMLGHTNLLDDIILIILEIVLNSSVGVHKQSIVATKRSRG